MKMKNIESRIKQVRVEAGLTQTEFGERIGVKGNTVTGYERGTRIPSDSVINNICKTFLINETWLRTGEGEVELFFPTDSEPLQEMFAKYNCNSIEQKFLISYFSLKETERYAFCELLAKMFPQAIPQLVGGDPLQPFWEEAEALPSAGDEEAYADFARQQRLLEKEQAAQALSAKESDAG